MKLVLAALMLCALAGRASAESYVVYGEGEGFHPVITPALGANVVAFTNGDYPSDYELGGAVAASLSPHISAVGGAWYGLGESYTRGTVGVKITATDANDRDFSIGIGSQYNASTDNDLRPQGWDGNATVGWRPYPQRLPRVVLVAQGAYLFDAETAFMTIGVRYALRAF